MEIREHPDFPDYGVSPDGRVWTCKNGKWGRSDQWRELRQISDANGYLHVGLRRDGRTHVVRVHRLVLEAFVGPCPDGMVTRHLNGVRDDNCIENLAWGTYGENAQDTAVHGRSTQGERNATAKLTEDDVRAIRSSQASAAKLASSYGVTQSTIYSVKSYSTWRHVS